MVLEMNVFQWYTLDGGVETFPRMPSEYMAAMIFFKLRQPWHCLNLMSF